MIDILADFQQACIDLLYYCITELISSFFFFYDADCFESLQTYLNLSSQIQ